MKGIIRACGPNGGYVYNFETKEGYGSGEVWEKFKKTHEVINPKKSDNQI